MEQSDRPDYLSPEWSDYVMTQFADNELFVPREGRFAKDGKGYPTTAGLRRVAELLLGTIVSSRPTQINPVLGDGVGRATVAYEITFLKEGTLVTYGDVADVFDGNTDDMFLVHAVATAATRAEGRVLRKALKLRTLAAEELTNKDASKFIQSNESVQTSTRISNEQINFIDNKCKTLNIDVLKLFDGVKNIYEVKREDAAKVAKSLTTYNNDRDSIPKSILGYSVGWRDNA